MTADRGQHLKRSFVNTNPNIASSCWSNHSGSASPVCIVLEHLLFYSGTNLTAAYFACACLHCHVSVLCRLFLLVKVRAIKILIVKRCQRVLDNVCIYVHGRILLLQLTGQAKLVCIIQCSRRLPGWCTKMNKLKVHSINGSQLHIPRG